MKTVFVCLSILFFVTVTATTARSQSPVSIGCPAGFVCITQAAANQAASNKRELDATKEKLSTLETALVTKDRIIADNKLTAAKNEADLKDRLHKTEVELATKTGTLVGCEASNVRNLAVIDVLLKNVRPKKIGLINF